MARIRSRSLSEQRHRSRRRATAARALRWAVERLESRVTPATIAVTGTGDTSAVDGVVTLREAITSVNDGVDVNADVLASGAYGTGDTINFAIAGSGLQTINVTGSGLPDIVRRVTIDGFTQLGSGFGALLIQLNGIATIPGTSGLTLFGVSGCLIRGLNIVNFDGGPLDAGIHIAGGSNNRVQGNVIGIGAGGNVALGNRQGVLINTGASDNIVGTDGDGVADASEGNLISGNPSAGVFVNGNGNRVAGNLIGTNAAGTATPGSHVLGVLISQATGNIVGTNGDGISDDLESNLISGSRGNGAEIAGSSSTGNRIAGNRIGTDITGTLPVPNESGVVVSGGASNNVTEGNIIAFNSLVGVAILGNSSVGNRISRNSIFANGNLGGIDLVGDGVTLNDPGDAVAGPNDLLNFPVLTSAQLAGPDLVLEGFARPGSAIELFVAAPDPTGFGEGRTYLVTVVEGSADDLDPSTGSYGPGPVNGLVQGEDDTNRFRFAIPLASLPGVAVGTALTATATLAGSTSEFSGNVTVAPPRRPSWP